VYHVTKTTKKDQFKVHKYQKNVRGQHYKVVRAACLANLICCVV